MARGTFNYTNSKTDNWLRKVSPRYLRAIQAIRSIAKTVNDSKCQAIPEKVDKLERVLYEEVENAVNALRSGKYVAQVESL